MRIGGGRADDLELEAFCHVEHPRLVRLLSLQCGDVEVAQELTQDTLAKVCQHWRKVRRMDEPSAWVTRVAINLALSHHRRSAVRRRYAAETGAAARLELADLQQGSSRDATDGWVVRAAIAELPVRQRTALVLRYFADLTVPATADLMGVSPSAVKKLTAKGVDTLRELLHTEIVEVSHD